MLTFIVCILSFFLGAVCRSERDSATVYCAPIDEDERHG